MKMYIHILSCREIIKNDIKNCFYDVFMMQIIQVWLIGQVYGKSEGRVRL